MTTHPPTGEGDGALPSWVPDEATLTRLANEFFGTMPGHGPQAPSADESNLPKADLPGPEEATAYAPQADLLGYMPPDLTSGFHRAAATPGRLAGLAGQPPATAVPGLPPATIAAILGATGARALERSLAAPATMASGEPSFYFVGKAGAFRTGRCASKSVDVSVALPSLLDKWAPIGKLPPLAVASKEAVRQVVRCACFIPGGIQCRLAMYHTGEHVYEPAAPFSEYLPAPAVLS